MAILVPKLGKNASVDGEIQIEFEPQQAQHADDDATWTGQSMADGHDQ
jgi:hypothetical protein